MEDHRFVLAAITTQTCTVVSYRYHSLRPLLSQTKGPFENLTRVVNSASSQSRRPFLNSDASKLHARSHTSITSISSPSAGTSPSRASRFVSLPSSPWSRLTSLSMASEIYERISFWYGTQFAHLLIRFHLVSFSHDNVGTSFAESDAASVCYGESVKVTQSGKTYLKTAAAESRHTSGGERGPAREPCPVREAARRSVEDPCPCDQPRYYLRVAYLHINLLRTHERTQDPRKNVNTLNLTRSIRRESDSFV
jgi:hypothetical protein